MLGVLFVDSYFCVEISYENDWCLFVLLSNCENYLSTFSLGYFLVFHCMFLCKFYSCESFLFLSISLLGHGLLCSLLWLFCCLIFFGGYCNSAALFSRSLFVCPVGIHLDPAVFASVMKIISASYFSAADCRLASFPFIPLT